MGGQAVNESLATPSAVTVGAGAPISLARAWMWLGVLALIGSGLLAVLLVLSRTPGIQDVFPLKDLFRAALVVHVDLSVAVWFMAFAALVWSAIGGGGLTWLAWSGFALAALGTALMSVSPFFPGAEPVLNNYIPVLQQPLFFASLWLFGLGLALTVVRALITTWPLRWAGEPLRLGAFLAALAAFLALAAFCWSWALVPRIEETVYFEVLFWGGGHTLQFQHCLLMVVAWLWMAAHLGQPSPVSGRALSVFFGLAALPLLAVPAIYLLVPAGSYEHMDLFARLMIWGHPYMAPLIVLAALLLWRVRKVPAAPAKSAFVASFVLFALGGVLGYLIQGVNVVIPAHYHGSTVGVTLAFMGLAYVLLPQLGFARAEGRLALWQPYVYGAGQLIHVVGLAWSGGYGVQRKVAGAEQMLISLPQKIGMGMMGLGGLIAVIGGLMFVLVCLRAMSRRQRT
ncbi:cytochrome C oxidase subunit I [Accumulibacter sp.]|uniref:cbb3-type cytochrome c oxidase subunit I n=1 Tax=Accumulibacter sp. TaxID=2053492 RepID=UPI002B6E563A|nr:cytochrome C oxidase subunit I [Accumulibacter sp.]HMW62266.1 cbb3-type cytochrome c oxidase subunit I [Accumulibacter sp.]HNG14360.1 cbb3-type cytochrome c oxidase subunit I [Accumulibacter sp.]HNG85580.1 cbb3-type cytochrome c oxidase subunit I [Accumulibacter sp.]HNH92464.1 cbb3-type cytochrome c oxidase subunit I [Accumulibacter sp.]HNI49949.1 cbb3-type cytochrome c oxidase subunit I [Accumulibacter sp.]